MSWAGTAHSDGGVGGAAPAVLRCLQPSGEDCCALFLCNGVFG